METSQHKGLIFSAVYLFLCISLYGQSLYAQDASPLHHFSLENGMDLFVLQDQSSPVVSVRLNVEGGFGDQTPDNTGFFELYSRLFWTGSKNFSSEKKMQETMEQWGIFSTTYRCAQNFSAYSAKAPYFSLEALLEIFADAVINPVFNEKSLIENLREYKTEIKMTQESPEGFLNSAVETVLFPREPWKQFSLVNTHLIEDISSGAARKILFSIRSEYYIPHRSALFVCGNVDVEKIYEIVRQNFGKWENPDYIPLKSKKSEDDLAKPGHFILKSEIFSRDFTQVAAYFPLKDSRTHIEGDMVASILEKRDSSFKNAVLKNPILGVENPDFVNVSYEARSDTPFLLVQLLLGKKFDFTVQQRELLRIFTNLSGFLPDEEIIAAKNEKIRAWKGEVSSNFSAISSFADNMGATGCSPNEFWSYEGRILRIQGSDLRLIPKRRPFVFYMLNPADEIPSVTAQRIIDENSKFWFDDEKFLAGMSLPKKVNTTPVVQDYMVLANSFYDHSVSKIRHYTTKSGMKITVNKNVTNENLAVCINFLGGDLISQSVQNAFLSEFAVAAFSRQLSAEKSLPTYAQISDEPSFEANRVIIKVRPGNLKKVMQAVAAALKVTPQPQIFDEALYRVRRRARQQRASNEYRMYAEAYRTILSQKPASHSLTAGDRVLEEISLKSAREAYSALADASRIQIAVSGNENFDEITSLCDTLFEFLQGKNNFAAKFEAAKVANSPVLPSKISSVKIERIFDADVKNKSAKGIPLLIPSKKQRKNVFVFFPIPNYNEEDFAPVGFLLEEFKERITNLLVKNNKLADEVKLFFAPNYSSLGYFTFVGVENFDELKKAFDRALILYKNVATREAEEFRMSKNRYLSKILAALDTNEGVAKLLSTDLMFSQKDVPLFLWQYRQIEGETWSSLRKTLFDTMGAQKFSWFFEIN